MKRKPIVIIESPYSGDIKANEAYLARALRDSIQRGEAPYASHGLYTREGVLDDTDPEERKLGMEVGFEFQRVADYVVVYTDRGVSQGMRDGIWLAKARHNLTIVYRSLDQKGNPNE